MPEKCITGHDTFGWITFTDLALNILLLLVDVKPEVAAKFDPKALPAYLLFMAVRYEDHVEQEMRIYEIFETATKTIKDVIRVSDKCFLPVG